MCSTSIHHSPYQIIVLRNYNGTVITSTDDCIDLIQKTKFWYGERRQIKYSTGYRKSVFGFTFDIPNQDSIIFLSIANNTKRVNPVSTKLTMFPYSTLPNSTNITFWGVYPVAETHKTMVLCVSASRPTTQKTKTTSST